MMTAKANKDLVLVVDDSPESLSMINDTLDAAGLAVLVALEGMQALSVAQSITPDIILLDAIMPNMDGFETCKKLKSISHLAHIPVIFMTGLSDTESIVKGFDAGGVDYIQKPVNGDELIARMRVHLNNARFTQSARIALDSAGQYLIATNSKGELQWATPQAQTLFENADLSHEWLHSELPSALEPIFSKDNTSISKDGTSVSKANTTISKDNAPSDKATIRHGDLSIEVQYISETHSDEHLLKLIDSAKPGEDKQLQIAFGLTGRESEVLLWLARGKGNADIAMILGVSPRTVNKHLEQVFRKLSVENRTSAAVMALKALESER